jgi:hypothetical protein
MFERNLAVRVFMYFVFGILALEFLTLGFGLDRILGKIGLFNRAIDTFNALLPYVLAVDFVIKFFFKKNASIQIAPYLTLPVKRSHLFDFLLRKEFTNFWNYYLLFLVVPFALKAATPYFGLPAAALYLAIFFLLCVANSLLANLVNILIDRSFWFYTVAAVIAACPFLLTFVCQIELTYYAAKLGEMTLSYNLWLYLGFAIYFALLWTINRKLMHLRLYSELQASKTTKISSFASLSFLDRFGAVGDFINLELKMILRSPRLKQQVVVSAPLVICLFFGMLYVPNSSFARILATSDFFLMFYGIFSIGLLGIIMGQYLFTSESTFFDGLAVRPLSVFVLLRSKYILYCAYSLLIALLLVPAAFQGKLSGFLLISLLLFVTGPVYFLMFQNAVYNKTHLDLFDKGLWNWKGTSGNMIFITMLTLFVPMCFVVALNGIFGKTTAYTFMFVSGLAFTLCSKYWLDGTYRRFLKRRYANMEGFRQV